jgi:hypothetical protein
MSRALTYFFAALIISQPAQAADDPRSSDAVAVFSDLCVSLFSGSRKSELDANRFSTTKIGEETARKIKPNVKGPLWDVSGTVSDVRMLVHYDPEGLCVVEVAEADEEGVRAAFEATVQQTSTALGSTPQRQPDQRNRIDGKYATTSMWRMKSPKGDIMLAITTYPDGKFMIQHVMTASYVR